jgi:tRNA G46 methylase TrmB
MLFVLSIEVESFGKSRYFTYVVIIHRKHVFPRYPSPCTGRQRKQNKNDKHHLTQCSIAKATRMSYQPFGDEAIAAKYQLHRPRYPAELFERITAYYFDGNCSGRKIPLAVDIACGNGQATIDLAA